MVSYNLTLGALVVFALDLDLAQVHVQIVALGLTGTWGEAVKG